MSDALIRARLATLLAAASGVGVVHSRQRRPETMDLDAFLALAKATPGTTGPVNMWFLYRLGALDDLATPNEQSNETHAYAVEGWYSFDDDAPSNTTWQALVDAVKGQFRFAGDLSTDAFAVVRLDTIALDLVDLSGILCHHAVIAVDVVERRLGTNTSAAVPNAPTASTFDLLMDQIATTLGTITATAPTVTRGRNFPLIRGAATGRHALMTPLARTEVERGSDVVQRRYPVQIRLSYDALDTSGAGDDATGEDAARHVRHWLATINSGLHRKTTATGAGFAAITGLVETEVVGIEEPDERLTPPWKARVEARAEAAAYVWESVA